MTDLFFVERLLRVPGAVIESVTNGEGRSPFLELRLPNGFSVESGGGLEGLEYVIARDAGYRITETDWHS